MSPPVGNHREGHQVDYIDVSILFHSCFGSTIQAVNQITFTPFQSSHYPLTTLTNVRKPRRTMILHHLGLLF